MKLQCKFCNITFDFNEIDPRDHLIKSDKINKKVVMKMVELNKNFIEKYFKKVV